MPYGLLQVGCQSASGVTSSQLRQGPVLDLANPLASKPILSGDLLQGQVLSIAQSKVEPQHLRLPRVQAGERGLQIFLLHPVHRFFIG